MTKPDAAAYAPDEEQLERLAKMRTNYRWERLVHAARVLRHDLDEIERPDGMRARVSRLGFCSHQPED